MRVFPELLFFFRNFESIPNIPKGNFLLILITKFLTLNKLKISNRNFCVNLEFLNKKEVSEMHAYLLPLNIIYLFLLLLNLSFCYLPHIITP